MFDQGKSNVSKEEHDMKKIIVGRGNDCDIVIPDDRDNVSRHHLVLSFNILGKVTVSDTSSNGTFINGVRMIKGASVPVSRKDEIRLGDSWKLDWSLVKDPYANIRRIALVVAVVLVLVCGGGFGWYAYQSNKAAKEIASPVVPSSSDTVSTTWNKDSTNKVAPTEASIDVGQTKVKAKSGSRKKNRIRNKKKQSVRNNKRQAPQREKSDNLKEAKSANLPVVN